MLCVGRVPVYSSYYVSEVIFCNSIGIRGLANKVSDCFVYRLKPANVSVVSSERKC